MMKVSMKRRLEKTEQRASPEEQYVIVLQLGGERCEEMPDRLERWKAGQDMPGDNSGRPSRGVDTSTAYVCPGRSGQE